LWTGRAAAVRWEHARLSDFAPEPFPLKNQGLAWQRVAATTPSALPLYGSSEMVKRADNKAGEFFRDSPTGFEVSPVGAGGTTSIIILQKLAALGPDLKDKKIAISLSPSWFFRKTASPYFYEGNFSAMAASEFAFGSNLGTELKREIAARMLQFPESLKKTPLLELAVTCLASQRRLDHALFWALWPLGKLQNIIFDLQDHFEAVVHHVPKPKGPPHSPIANPIKVRESQAPPLDDDVRHGGDLVFL
jgi:D-alanine transfer protein